jgi:chromatin remodeling complex protein RSC6
MSSATEKKALLIAARAARLEAERKRAEEEKARAEEEAAELAELERQEEDERKAKAEAERKAAEEAKKKAEEEAKEAELRTMRLVTPADEEALVAALRRQGVDMDSLGMGAAGTSREGVERCWPCRKQNQLCEKREGKR